MPQRFKLWHHTLAHAFYMLLLLIITQPLITQLNTVFIGSHEGDAHEYIRHIWWLQHALQTGQPLFQQPLLAYPDGLSAAWLWGNPLQSFPAWLFAFIMPLPAAYNLMVLLWLSLNGWAMFYLVRRLLNGTHTHAPLTDHATQAALVAGTAYMLYPAMQGQLFGSHAGLLVLWGAPLYLDALLRLRTHTRPWDYLRVAVFFVVSLLGNTLLLIYLLLPLTLYIGISRLVQRQWGWLVRCVAGASAGLLLSLIFILPVLREQAASPVAPNPNTAITYGADLLAVVSPSFYNPLFTDLTYSRNVLGTNLTEGVGYLGIVAGLLAVVGLWRFAAARGWLLLIAVTWAFSLSPLLKFREELVTVTISGFLTYLPAPSLAFGSLPVLSAVRSSARFNIAVGFGVAVLVGYGAAWLFNRLSGGQAWRRIARYVVVGLLITLIALDYQLIWERGLPTVATIPAEIPSQFTALRDDDGIRAVFNLPYQHPLAAKHGLYLQTAHHKPLVAGHVTRQTPVDPAKLEMLQATLDAALLNEAGADVIILHREWGTDELEAHAQAQLGPPTFTDEHFMLWHLGANNDA